MKSYRVHLTIPTETHFYYEIEARDEESAMKIAADRIAENDDDWKSGDGGAYPRWDWIDSGNIQEAEEVED